MRIAIVAVGTQGDLQPALVLGQGLKTAGHEVQFVASNYYHDLARKHGLDPIDLDSPDPRSTMAAVQAETLTASRWQRYFRIWQPTGAPSAAQKQRMVDSCRGVEVILSNYALFRHAAEHLGIKYIGFGVTPQHATREFPHPLSRLSRSGNGWFNLATYRAIHWLFWSREQRWVNTWRQQLGLPLERFSHARQKSQASPFLYGISPTLFPRPQDWPNHVCVTGSWSPRESADWRPSPGLQEFLHAGPPPVAVGFGSLVDPDPVGLQKILVTALQTAGVRGLILGGWSGAQRTSSDRQIFCADWIPFPWLLPRMSALVHHAGAGTCAQAVAAGVPSVCIAYSGEQWFWAGRLESLGVSAARFPRRTLNVDPLAYAIRRAHTDPALRTATTRLSQLIAREEGVTHAVAALENWVAVGPPPVS